MFVYKMTTSTRQDEAWQIRVPFESQHSCNYLGAAEYILRANFCTIARYFATRIITMSTRRPFLLPAAVGEIFCYDTSSWHDHNHDFAVELLRLWHCGGSLFSNLLPKNPWPKIFPLNCLLMKLIKKIFINFSIAQDPACVNSTEGAI